MQFSILTRKKALEKGYSSILPLCISQKSSELERFFSCVSSVQGDTHKRKNAAIHAGIIPSVRKWPKDFRYRIHDRQWRRKQFFSSKNWQKMLILNEIVMFHGIWIRTPQDRIKIDYSVVTVLHRTTDNSVSAVGQKIGIFKNVFGSVLLRLTHVNVTLNKADRHKSLARNSISHCAIQSVVLSTQKCKKEAKCNRPTDRPGEL